MTACTPLTSSALAVAVNYITLAYLLYRGIFNDNLLLMIRGKIIKNPSTLYKFPFYLSYEFSEKGLPFS